MSWFDATILFVSGLIAFTILLLVGQSLMPLISSSMGATVAFLVSTIFVIILALNLFTYFNNSQNNDDNFPKDL